MNEALATLSLEAPAAMRNRVPLSGGAAIHDRLVALVKRALREGEHDFWQAADFNTCLRDKNIRCGNEAGFRDLLDRWEQSVGSPITAVRFAVNRIDKDTGLGLISVRVIPAEAAQIQTQTVSPTAGFLPAIISRKKRHASAGSYARVAFRPEVAEALRVTSPTFRGSVIAASDLYKRPKRGATPELRDGATHLLRGMTTEELRAGDTSLRATHDECIVVEVPCFDPAKLAESGLPFALIPRPQDPEARAYICEYPTLK